MAVHLYLCVYNQQSQHEQRQQRAIEAQAKLRRDFDIEYAHIQSFQIKATFNHFQPRFEFF